LRTHEKEEYSSDESEFDADSESDIDTYEEDLPVNTDAFDIESVMVNSTFSAQCNN